MSCGRLGGVVARTLALMIVRRVLGVLGCGPTPDADAVEIAVLRHQLAVLHRQVASPVYADGSDDGGRVGQAVAVRAVGGIRGHPLDADALASGADRPAVDLPTHC